MWLTGVQCGMYATTQREKKRKGTGSELNLNTDSDAAHAGNISEQESAPFLAMTDVGRNLAIIEIEDTRSFCRYGYQYGAKAIVLQSVRAVRVAHKRFHSQEIKRKETVRVKTTQLQQAIRYTNRVTQTYK
ncbi:hypothetical protein Tcan_12116 [Toxocara canis]|uniref:Uncharacterized protein n=1 Tax=Toxocara canis TaxID=6265 RepID=A0A0B2USG4_TOXCA|nr:hypothetical protein Tcan_12116 [Toxocara canis]